ncbi:hypothetical protein L7F22_052879 [Adiantum nelumboides]|nr:hypothetical protein [Adiantum nelumboides]
MSSAPTSKPAESAKEGTELSSGVNAAKEPVIQAAIAGEDEEDDEEDDEEPAQGSEEKQLTSKQKKKKKSKAAAKLRKKLGLGGGDTGGESSSSAPEKMLTDDDVKNLQDAIAKEQGPQAAAKADRATLEKLMKMMNMERTAMLKDHDAKQKQYKTLAEHKFWKTQPVTKPTDAPLSTTDSEGPIEPNVTRDQVRQEPYPLPSEFEWSPIDIDDATELREVYDLLSANYVEDIDSSLRFNYSPEFLNWVLKHPGYHKSWHVGVRVKNTRKLVAFISAIPHELRVREQAYPSAEVNFLCVHKKLRSKRLTPVLIKEVTRQCHLLGIFQAIYTGGIVIPTPIACARYYHRTINAEKLLDIGFSGLRPGQSRDAYVKQYSLPAATRVAGLREIEEKDIPAVGKLMRRFMKRFDMAARFSDDEVAHLLLSGKAGEGRKQVTWTYVVEDHGKITDMISFYSLPSSILDSDKHQILEAAYLFYYATDAAFNASPSTDASFSSLSNLHKTHLTSTEQEDEQNVTNWSQESKESKATLKKRLNELVYDMLILAKNNGFDVLNCLTVMDNPLFLTEQLFGPGDGFLRHYLFNWRIRPIAGGMGARPGEAELDPVVQYAKLMAEKEAKAAGQSLSEGDRVRKLQASLPRAEMGSGTGIVMV